MGAATVIKLGSTNNPNIAGPSTGVLNSMPPQKIPFIDKDKEWRERCINAIIGLSNFYTETSRNTRYRKIINHNLNAGIFDERDMEYITDPYKFGDKFGGRPSKMLDYNLIKPKIDYLKGKELLRPFNYSAVAVNGEAVSDKQKEMKSQLDDSFEQYFQSQLKEQGINNSQDEESTQPQQPEDIKKYFSYSYKDIREKTANDLLKFLEKQQQLQFKFSRGFEDALITGEEVYYIGIINDEPILRLVNNVDFYFDRSTESDRIEKCQWCREDRWLTVGEVIDEYGEFLTEEEVDRLDKGFLSNLGNFGPEGMETYFPGFLSDRYNNSNIYNYNSHYAANSGLIQVHVCCWKSLKDIYFVTYLDDKDEEQETILYEKPNFPKEVKDRIIKVEKRWINEVWKGTRIGGNIFVDIKPLENQYRSMENVGECDLPYVGKIYGNVNTKSMSLVDICKPHQYLYNIGWWKLQEEMAKAKGKKFIMDVAQIPRTEGINTEKWMYYFMNTDIAFINSMEEGRENDPNSVSKFNQFTSVDMTMSQAIGQIIGILDKIEATVDSITGISKQSVGEISPSETATGVQSAKEGSSVITEFMFYNHNMVKEIVLQKLIECAKLAYAGGKKIHYITDDMERIYIDVDDKLNDTEFGIFVTNSIRDNAIKEKIMSLFDAALQSNKATLSDVVSAMQSTSTAEIKHILLDSEQRAIKQQQDQEKQAQDSQERIQSQMLASQKEDKDLDRKNKIEVAQIQATSKNRQLDQDNDGTLDQLEFQKIAQKNREIESKQVIESAKINNDNSNENKRILHEKEMKDKDMEIERLKIKNKPKSK